VKKLILLITSILFSNNSNASFQKDVINTEKHKSLFEVLNEAKVVKTQSSESIGRTGGGGNIGPKADK
jgi:hypothetical protein